MGNRIIHRRLAAKIRQMLGKFPIVSLTGPRQSGKTTLLRNYFPEYQYYNLERIDHRNIISGDPLGFLRTSGEKIIFDEAQRYPELFSHIQVVSDERGTTGQYILSGSQSFLLNEKISQSLAGRVNIKQLFPFDILETGNYEETDYIHQIFRGFYPRIYNQEIDPVDFYPSLIQTYIERDVRSLKNITNLGSFSRFLSLLAGRTGQIINLTSLANDAGISVNTVKSWLSILEAGFVIFLLQPYYRNFNKRIIKAPKLYFYDTGIVCSLLRIHRAEDVRNHYLFGALFENLVISEILKIFHHSGAPVSLFFLRESNGREIDCIIEKGHNDLIAIEIKGGETYSSEYIKNINSFNRDLRLSNFKKAVVYTGIEKFETNEIKIIPWKNFLEYDELFMPGVID